MRTATSHGFADERPFTSASTAAGRQTMTRERGMSGHPSFSRRGFLAGSLSASALLGTGDRGFAQATSDWQAGAPAEWTRVLEAARKEGQVTVAGFPLLAEKMSAAFKRDTGIQLNFLGGNTGDQSARL